MYPTTTSTTPNFNGTLNLNTGSTGSLLSAMGTKAASPGGVNTTSTNTLTPKQTAPASQQTVAAPNPFATNASKAAGNLATGIGTTLSQNTQPFNPATVGTFNTTPPPPTYNISASTMPSLSNAPQTTSVGQTTSGNNVVSTGGSNGSGNSTLAPAPTNPFVNPNAPIMNQNAPQGTPLTQTGSTAALLAQTAQQGSQTGQQATQQLAQTSAASSPAATAAQQATAQAGQLNPALAANAAAIQQNYAQQEQNALQAGGPQISGLTTMGGGPIGLGQAGAVQEMVNAYQTNLQGQETQALNANAQGLTAANQQATAENEAGNLANTQQGNIQSGLTSAAGAANTAQGNVQSGLQQSGSLTQPSGTYPFSYNPATGQFTTAGGASLDPQTTATQLAQGVINGSIPYATAVQTMGYIPGGAGTAMLSQAIIAAGGNITNLQASAAAQQANVQTAGTTATNIASTGATAATQAYNSAYQINQTASQTATLLQNSLSSTGVNSSNVNDYNAVINSLSSRLGSTGITQVSTYLQELQNAYSNLLSTGGGTPSGQEAQALSILDINHSANQINTAISALQSAAYAKLQPMYQQAQQYNSALSSSVNSSTAAPGGFAWNP